MTWVLRLAWRDSRGYRRRLLLYTASIAVGVAALTSLRGLSRAMEAGVEQQALELLGAAMEVENNRPFSDRAQAVFDSLGGRQARQAQMLSMVFAPVQGVTRLCDVRAVRGDWPLYGELRTDPAQAAWDFRAGRQALVDDALLLQFGAEVGDSVRVGRVMFRVAGRLLNLPGQTAVQTDMRPPVLIPYAHLEETGLVQFGSQVRYRALFAFDDDRNLETLARELESTLQATDRGIQARTARQRQRRLIRASRTLESYLGLGGFVALLLGAVGVASAIHAYIQSKLKTVAILRSLGVTSRQAFCIYMVQTAMMGAIGSTAGAAAGTALLFVMPGLIGDFLPGRVQVSVSAVPGLEGVGIGTATAMLFAALPLLAVRSASPLLALRSAYERGVGRGDRLLRGLLVVAAAGGAWTLARLLTGDGLQALYYTAGSGAALALLAVCAHGVRAVVRRCSALPLGYIARQGLANLHRPNNQTLLLMVSLGLGTFLVAVMYTTQRSVLAHIQRIGGEDQPNVVLFDIQTDQRAGLDSLVQDHGLPVLEHAPVVAMHIAAVQGTPVDSSAGRSWELRREYRSTYRDHLTPSEALVAGAWHGAGGDTAFVSIEVGLAGRLGVGVGDSLTFDVHGIPVQVVVGSLRQVDWQRIAPNFFLVFSPGVLEAAPQFHVLVTRGDSPEERARLQRQVVDDYPNVAVIDLDLILRTVDDVLERVAAIVRFMAMFSVATGCLVLLAAVSASRFQRLRDSALLRALGARRGQVRSILLVEYAALGLLAAATGLILALAAGWALASHVFDVGFVPAWRWLAAMLIAVPLLTVLVGLGNSRGITAVPPLEVLRRSA